MLLGLGSAICRSRACRDPNVAFTPKPGKYLQKIIAEHPGTSYAKEAKALLKKMGA
jgi:hypothetical protein